MNDKQVNFDNLDDYAKSKKVKCSNCGREVKDLEKGCTYCNNSKEYNTENYNVKLESIMREKNLISSVLKVIGWITLIVGFILGFVLGKDTYGNIEFISLLQVWLVYCGVFLSIYTLAEIIQILHDIRFKVWKK